MMEEDAAVDDTDYLPRGAESKTKKKTAGKRPKKKQDTWPTHYANSLPQSALMTDSDLTASARLDLQAIRRRIEAQIEASDESDQGISEEGFEYVLDNDDQPLFSVSVQQLIYSIVDTAIRGRRLRSLPVAESGDRRFQVVEEYIELRFMLRDELEAALDLEDGVDCSAVAQRLVVEEFPLDW